MTAVMIHHGKGITADGARLQWHMVLIADMEVIARNTRGEENGLRLGASHSDTATARTQHLSGNVRENHMLVATCDAKHRSWKHHRDGTLQYDGLFRIHDGGGFVGRSL